MSDPVVRLTSALADRYVVERELGAGGMALVYLARDLKHERPVALKVLRPELGVVVGVERFLSEIRVTAALQHPNILPLFDSGEADGLVYYAMPYVQGETLRSRLDREHQLPIDEALSIARGVASALDYAHRRGVVHRDVKPENILFQDGQPVVTDFGISLALTGAAGDRLTEAGLSLGTPFYMSPEQATGDRPLDGRTDIYALGCVLYEMLTGEPPFTGRNATSVIARILTERPRDASALRESVPAALDRTVAKALSRLPADRFLTAARFGEALGQVAVSSVSVRPDGAESEGEVGPVRVTKPAPSRLASAAPWAIAVTAILVSLTGWLRPGVPSTGPAPGEVSTEQLAKILETGEALVLDTRPHLEYSISHIPGAVNVAARPGVPMSMYVSDVAEVRRLVEGNLTRPIVLYCNGPLCPKSRRLADELENAGHTNVRRYQLGMPVWRAYGGVTVMEPDGLRYVLDNDRTAVVIDARAPDSFHRQSVPGARNLPRSGVLDGLDTGEVRAAKDDGRLPMEDHNTRIIVLGETAEEARYVAQAIANEAFHNVSYFSGTVDQALAAVR